MTAAVLLLGLAVSQPAEPDYFPFTSRSIKLPIVYKKDRSSIRDVHLFVSRDQGATWELTANATPKDDAFTYVAKEDGVYWFHLVTVDLKGTKDPADLTKELPAMKVLVDTAPPFVRITDTKRVGEEVVVQWVVEDKFWDEQATKVYFHAVSLGDSAPWREVKLVSATKSGVRFPPGTSGAVVVKVMVQDLAGTKAETIREVSASGVAQVSTSTSLTPSLPKPSEMAMPMIAPPKMSPEMVPPPTPQVTEPITSPGMPPMPILSPSGNPGVVAPSMPPAMFSPTPSAPIAPTMTPIATGQAIMPSSPLTPTPAPAPVPLVQEGPKPIASTSGQVQNPQSAGFTTAAAPAVEPIRTPVLNKLRFDLAYEVEQKGPSGISRVDLWATRDEGRTWQRWSQHDGRETPIRVALDLPGNRKLEGAYGFRLVPVSGAGLSDSAPTAGDAPEMRVIVDVTPPVIELFQPSSDPHALDTLVIPWRAADDNFGDDPITIEWSEHPNGPWKPVTGGPADAVVPVANVVGGPIARLPNTGRFAWRVPATLPTHKVYLKVIARDQAGNTSEVTTPSPILVDLAKPRARIQGILPTTMK